MKIYYTLVITLIMLVSCKSQQITNEVIIEGNVKNIPDGKIYLAQAHYWDIPLDSTECRNGHFIFKMKTDSSFVPYKAAIHFPDNTKPAKLGGLFYRNHMLGDDSIKYSGDAFYLEKGYTRIEGDNEAKLALRVFAGKETDLMYKNQFKDFGRLGNIDSNKRESRIKFFKTEIKENPFSYFLLQSIFNHKEQYSKQEILDILSLFNNDVQKSKNGDLIRTYLLNRPDPDDPYPNLSLLNSSNQRHNIIDTTSKLNMLVFWASWCKPCRIEIPLLKEIQNKYRGKGLNVVSISIDENKDDWEKALAQEKMVWSQYLVDKDNINVVMQNFNFSAIPLVVFTDKEGREIMKFLGYDKEAKENYEAVIKKFIN